MSQPHILIVDDDPVMLRALPEILQRQMDPIRVDTSNSPRDALARITTMDYDAIISDIKMPSMDGLTLLGEVRHQRPDTPILLMTAHDDRDLVVNALRGGAYDFIQKPIDGEYMVASLHRAIQMRLLSRQVAAQKQALEQHASELEHTVQRALADAQGAQRRLAFLAEASTLLASSLDYEATLGRLGRLAVLYLADYCLVDVLEDDGTLRAVGIAHVDRAQESLLRQMRARYPAGPTIAYPAQAVIQSGQPILQMEVTEAFLGASALDADHLDVFHRLHPRSAMILPLVAQQHILGVITFVLTGPGRRYNTDDLALAEDLTRRASLAVHNARLYAEAQQALHVRDQFLSIAAHELRTPMTSILATTQLLLRQARRAEHADPKEVRRLHILADQTRRLNQLVLSLLDLSRLEAGQLTIERGPVDLAGLTRRVVEEMSLALDRHTIRCHCVEAAILVDGDELRLDQVLQNLLQNAIKYSPDGGTVEITVRREGAQAVVTITDQGIGIPPEAVPQLFSRFYRAENVGSRQISGMGLGLYVVREIISLHGGTIEVTSQEGAGSTFTLRLPLAPPEEQADEPVAEPADAPPAEAASTG